MDSQPQSLTPIMSRPSTQLRKLLDGETPASIMEAHNGLSARIASEAGFPAIWASGLSISAAMGVRDNNEASWTQVLEVVELMADAASVPVLVDGDTGFGNFNNFRRVIRKLGERGAGGVCIEDKLFPKTNSFINGAQQPLAPVDEFCGKIRAGKDAQSDDDFVLIARTEALIAGWGVGEALRRAEAYRTAGVDAIVVHSAESTPDQVFAFLKEWDNRLPVVLIPTKYVQTPVEEFAQRRVAALVWANHLLRASVSAMQGTASEIMRTGTAAAVESQVAPIAEIFRLQNAAELGEAEQRYLPISAERSAIILAATRGSGPLELLTEEIPKTLLKVSGTTLLDRLCDQLRALAATKITVVAGYRADAIKREGVRRVDNGQWAETGEVASLALALEHARGETFIVFGDVICRRHLFELLRNDDADVSIIADQTGRQGRRDRIRIADAAPSAFLDETSLLLSAANSEAVDDFHAEWVGVLKLSPVGLEQLRSWVEGAKQREDFNQLDLIDLLNEFARGDRKVAVHLISEGWTSVEDALDLAKASNV